MTNWISYSILIPLFPIIIAVLVGSLKGESINIEAVFGGTDLYMLSIVLLATTRSDIESTALKVFKSGAYSRVATLLIPAYAVLQRHLWYNLLWIRYLRIPIFPRFRSFSLAYCLGLSSFAVCGLLQFKLRREGGNGSRRRA